MKLTDYDKIMLDAIILTATEFKNNEDDIVSALETINTAVKELYKSDFYKQQSNS